MRVRRGINNRVVIWCRYHGKKEPGVGLLLVESKDGLWIGENFFLKKDEVIELVKIMSSWVENGSISVIGE